MSNHILILGGPNSGKIRVCELLSKEKVDVEQESHSGVIVKTKFKTKYYETDLSIMVDEFPPARSMAANKGSRFEHLDKWVDEFCSEACKELRECIDGFVFTVNLENETVGDIERIVEVVEKVKDSIEQDQEENEVFFVIMGVSSEKIDYTEVEDVIISSGLEFIYFNEEGVNEYKDRIGKDRFLEVLETHEWTESSLSHDYESNKLNKVSEMTKGLLSEEIEPEPETETTEKDDVVDLGPILEKLRIAKEKTSGMNEEEKDQYVKSVIDDVINYI